MLEVRALHAWWGAAQVLFGVSLEVGAGELVVLQGLNGAGKSSLMHALMGLGPRVQADIRLQGRALAGLPTDARARAGLGFVPEDRRLFTQLSVRHNLTLAARPGRGLTVAQQLDAMLALFPGLRPALQRPAAQLSGGEQQMLALARTLMTQPRVLLLDEPCEGIAPVLVEAMRDALLALKRGGMPMLVAEQNPLLAAHADRVITLTAGQITADRTP